MTRTISTDCEPGHGHPYNNAIAFGAAASAELHDRHVGLCKQGTRAGRSGTLAFGGRHLHPSAHTLRSFEAITE